MDVSYAALIYIQPGQEPRLLTWIKFNPNMDK